jgi:uncharacterized protein (TIGR02271 family)
MSSTNYSNPTGNLSGNRTVAFFSRRQDAYRAVEALRDAGYNNDEIGLIAQGDIDRYESTTADADPATRNEDRSFWQSVKDFFTGESHDDYDYDTHYSDATGDLGWSTDRADYYRSGIRAGGALVTVSGARSSEARAILESNGGDLRESGFDNSQFQTSSTTTGQSAARGVNAGASDEFADQRIQLRGERLRTFKERVQRGEVRLRKEVITENQQVEVPVTREEIVIERAPASGNVRVAGDIGSDQDIRVPLSEERVRVEKQPVVNEEVRVGKRQVQRSERVSGDVRHEELRVDKDGDVDVNTSAPRKRKDPAA